ncbi:MAG TPA: hypothetical protein VLA37_00535 [Sphingomonadaceae bacterium]|nr:hypothetical protein [Sphingomonadaceae bacterium]
MTNVHMALCWAAAILLNALGNYLGYIDDSTAQTLFIVLPIVAMLSLRGQASCALDRGNRA